MLPTLNTSWKRLMTAGAVTGVLLSLMLLLTHFEELLGNMSDDPALILAFILLIFGPMLIFVPYFLIIAVIVKFVIKLSRSNTVTAAILIAIPAAATVGPMLLVFAGSDTAPYVYMTLAAVLSGATFFITTVKKRKNIQP